MSQGEESDTNLIASQLVEEESPLEAPPEDGGSWYMSLVPMVLIFVVFYFLLIRPQENKRIAHEKMVTGVKKGEEVLTSAGIYGKVVKLNDSDATVDLEVAKDVKIKVFFV